MSWRKTVRQLKTNLPCKMYAGSSMLCISVLINIILVILGLLRHFIFHYCKDDGGDITLLQLTPNGDSFIRSTSLCMTSSLPSSATRSSLQTSKAVSYLSPVQLYNASVPSSDFIVPNTVHYIWYNTEPRPLQFHHMLCILSAFKLLQPDMIYFHTNIEPTGIYWKRVVKLPKFKINYRQPPTTLFGERVKEPLFYTSHSNVDRVKVLLEYGGIYLDLDVLITRPFDDLRHYPCTVGREQETKACGSVIVCAKDSPFLLLWMNSYLDDYQVNEWAYNTGQVPFNLARRFPHLIHLDENRINRPNFDELDVIWGEKTFNWQKNYAVHLWYRLWKEKSPYFQGVEPNDENVKTWNSTFGEMARSVLYGVKGAMSTD